MAEYRLIMADKTKQLYDESTPLYIGGYNKNVSNDQTILRIDSKNLVLATILGEIEQLQSYLQNNND